MGDGRVQRAGQELPDESYVPFEAKRLRNARVLWVNFEALRDLGIEIPKEGLTTEFEEQILKQFAYMVPQEQDPQGTFLDESKTFYADRYGGHGIGNNGGSARAASTGPLQVKNIGQTPLRGPQITFDHSHGGGSIKEAIQEAVWGEVANRELPWKANRVLFILDTGSYTHWPDGSQERRSLIVREDPFRPAHFIPAYFYKAPAGQVSEELRVEKAIDHLLSALPDSRNHNFSKLEEMYDRMSDQVATARAKKIFHGALSASNIEVSGRYMDYASLSTTVGYVDQQADHHSIKSFNHEIDRIKSNYEELHGSLSQHASFSAALPTLDQMNQFIEGRFHIHKRRAFLEQLGFPKTWVLRNQNTPEAQKLFQALEELIDFDSKTRVSHQDDFSKVKLHARLNDLVQISLSNPQASESVTASKLSQSLDIPEGNALKLVQSLKDYFRITQSLALSEGIPQKALLKGLFFANELKNQNMKGLYREPFKRDIVNQVDGYLWHQDRSHIWEYIDNTLDQNKRNFSSSSPLYVVLSEKLDRLHGKKIQYVYAPQSDSLKKVEGTLDSNLGVKWIESVLSKEEAHHFESSFLKRITPQGPHSCSESFSALLGR